jgi:hypothetical protein
MFLNIFLIQKKVKLCIIILCSIINYTFSQEVDYGTIFETEFANNLGNVIYYSGALEQGFGKFWIYEDNIKRIILETYTERRPMVIWHNEYLAEIPLGFDTITSYYFDFRDNTISKPYYFPMHIDLKNNYVIILGVEGLDVYNIKTNELIQEYKKEKIFEGVESFHFYYFNYEIRIENNKLIFSFWYYKNWVEIIRVIEFKYDY